MTVSESISEKIILIRRFEENLLDLFSQGKLFGTTHTYLGQEAIGATLSEFVNIDHDYVFSSHRCHGHFIALGGDPEALIAEIMGKDTGVCSGKGGSQHLKFKNFFSNGIQGGIAGNATGLALQEKLTGVSDAIVVVFLGDGTLGEGLVYESLNFASLKQLPILYILENNQFAQSTPIANGVSGNIQARAEAFGIATSKTDSNDFRALHENVEAAVSFVREKRQPMFLVANTYRLGPHSKGDDNRSEEEIDAHRQYDPMVFVKEFLGDELFNNKNTLVLKKLEGMNERALLSPFPQIKEEEKSLSVAILDSANKKVEKTLTNEVSYLKAINLGLENILEREPKSFLIGEDIVDPYGGAFKVTKGLSSKYPQRVISTPISELGLVSWSVGAALIGAKPIAEIMFSDFLTLAYDQILNHATKYAWMYDHQVECPLIIRTASGGGRGYGPTHSQSIEKYFIGVPGLTVVAPSLFVNPGDIIINVSNNIKGPTIFIEHKLIYPSMLKDISSGHYQEFQVESDQRIFPNIVFKMDHEPAESLIIVYGGMVEKALTSAKELLIEDEVECDVLVTTLLHPSPVPLIKDVINKYKNIFLFEENDNRGGWGSDAAYFIHENCPRVETIRRVGSLDIPIPSSGPIESEALAGVKELKAMILTIVE